jgi:hypothetical protein
VSGGVRVDPSERIDLFGSNVSRRATSGASGVLVAALAPEETRAIQMR